MNNRNGIQAKKKVFQFFLVFFSIIFLSCFLAPVVMKSFMVLGQKYSFFYNLSQAGTHRILSRLIMIFAIISLIVFRKAIFSSGKVLGLLKANRRDWGFFGIAFLFGVITLSIHVTCAILVDARVFFTHKLTYARVSGDLFKCFFSASLIGFLEEFIFRGVLFGWIRQKLSWVYALILSSAVYSMAHFFRPKSIVGIEDGAMFSGFMALGQMLKPMAGPEFFSEMTGLFLVGACLCAGYHYTKSLYFAIGLHAGWVFVIKMDGLVASRTVADKIFLWGASNFVGGIYTWVLLIIIFFIIQSGVFGKKQLKND